MSVVRILGRRPDADVGRSGVAHDDAMPAVPRKGSENSNVVVSEGQDARPRSDRPRNGDNQFPRSRPAPKPRPCASPFKAN